MARKYDFISELYNRTCKTVVASPASWEAFLRSACYNYRLRFDEQLLVHAQRPDATAVLQIDDWNQKFGRWVNRGAHGIAVFEDADQRRQRLVHYFDISDTHPSRFSRRVPIWQMRDEYTAEVIDTLESTFGELNDKETLAAAIESAARNAVEDNIPDYLPDLIYSVKDSFLDGVSEEEITHIFKTAVRNSVAYMTMTRLGIEAGEYFEPDDLRDVVNFTTPATLNALGYATSDIAEMGLAEISRTILALDRQNRIIAEKTKADYNVGKEKNERSPDDERDHLHEAGGLSVPRSDNAGAAGAVDGQVRPDAEEVPEGASQGTLLQPADELRPERASERHGAQSERDGTDADGADGSVGGRDGESESDGYDELGSEDEQYPEPSSGDRDGGGNLRLDYYDRSHEDKSLPFFGGDDTIREILGTTPHLKASKDEIRAFFEATADENARISYIKRIFNNDYTEVILSDGRRVGYKTYQNVLQLWEGSYLSRTAQSFYDWGVIAQHFEAMRLLGELQDTMKPLPSIDGQLSLMTAGAEERKPSAFTFSQEIIDAVLTRGSGISEGKMRIYEQFQKSLSAKENADFLKNEYGWGGAYPVIVGADIDEQHDGKGIRISKGIGSDKPHIDLKWSQVEKRIAELIKLDRYLNPKEKAQYPEWLQRQEERRAALAEERRNREILSTAPSEKAEPKNERYEYHLGSTVYTDLTNVGIAYTTTEDDKHEIQARVNLVDFRIETLADGKVVRSVQYSSIEELTEKGLQALSFDDLVYLSEEELAQVEAPLTPVWEHPKKSRVQTFDIHPEIPMADRHIILVDEVSMMDIHLAGKLLESVRSNAQIVMIGDSDQLPSVGPGAVLSEMIASARIPVVRLDRVFRQTDGSRIAVNAKLIRHGNLSLEYGSDFRFVDSANMSDSANRIAELYMQEVAKYGVDNVALLSPYRQKTETGVNALNELLREMVNPPEAGKQEVTCGKRKFRTGDKVMQIKNFEDVNNGDIGYIRSIFKFGDEATVVIDFGDGRTKEYDSGELDMIDLGYASTIHKSQGSEYKSVIINLQCAHHIMLTRPLVYTAITRGKERVIIVGERRALCIAVKKTDTEKRGTCLAHRLQELA